ncbi:hypothetical protein FBU30_000965, partial [Linnemannia zychae]
MTTVAPSFTTLTSHPRHQHSRSNSTSVSSTSPSSNATGTTAAELNSTTTNSNANTSNSTGGGATTSALSFSDRIRAAEHRFTTLTQNIAHFSPLKTQLDKHNLTIERLESDIKKKTAHLQACQDKLKSISKRPQTSGQGSHVSLHAASSGDSEADVVAAQHQATKDALEALNGQLLAAKIL